MNSKEINDRIAYLELVIFNIKVNVNSGNYLSGYEIQDMINERNTLKKELYHLRKVQKLREERKLKLDQIENK